LEREKLIEDITLALTFASKDLGNGDRLMSEFTFDNIAEFILDKILEKTLAIEDDGTQIALRKIEEFISEYQRGLWETGKSPNKIVRTGYDVPIIELVSWLQQEYQNKGI
jgi:hypothetical protein